MPADEIDVRTMAPRDRHPEILRRLDALEVGTALRLVNDHDPKPFHYQLQAEHPGEYRWDVVEDGPERWAIDITKRAHVVDARPVLAAGGEPFEIIMEAAAKVGEDEILVVWAPFEPVPLEGVLGEQGFTFEATEIDADTWRVTFSR